MDTFGGPWQSVGVPQPSKDAVDDIDAFIDALREKGVDPNRVSYPCTIGQHEDCTGKVMREGATVRYERCRCPDCKHSKPRVLPA